MSTTPADQYAEGMRLAGQGDFERAQKLLAGGVTADPGDFDVADGFLLMLARKFRQTGVVGRTDQEQTEAVTQAAAKGDWETVLHVGPRNLCSNPWDVPTLLAMAQACESRGHDETELRYLQMAYEAAPSDAAVNRHCGRSMARMKKFDEAIACWQRVSELAPGDKEAARMASQLAIEKSRQRGEKPRPQIQPDAADEELLEPSSQPVKVSTRDHETGEIDLTVSLAAPIPIEVREAARPSGEFMLTPVQQLEAAIREFPANAEYYVELIPMYLDMGREYDAERILTKAKALTDDFRVRQLWEDVVMLRMSKKIAVAQQIAAKEKTEEARDNLAGLCAERDRFETEVFVSRSLREPKNAAIRYQLGLRLRQAGKLREALQCFAEALHDPAQKPLCALEMGRCHEEQREFPEALQRYRLAAESATSPDQRECKKQALYLAGGLARRIKMNRLAHRYLSELVQLDPRYRDAAAWLKELPR